MKSKINENKDNDAEGKEISVVNEAKISELMMRKICHDTVVRNVTYLLITPGLNAEGPEPESYFMNLKRKLYLCLL